MTRILPELINTHTQYQKFDRIITLQEVLSFFISVNGGDGDDNITLVAGSIATVLDTIGNNEVYNEYSNATILTGSGNDSIYSNAENVIIDAASGNNSIDASGNSVSIKTDYGDDYVQIYSNAQNVTINTGEAQIQFTREGLA